MAKPELLVDRRAAAVRRIAAHFAEHLNADLSLRLWTGEVVPLGANARDDLQIVLADPSAVRRLILAPSLMTLFELLATGDLRIEGGSALEAADRWDHGKAIHLVRRINKLYVAGEAATFMLADAAPRPSELPAWDAKGQDGIGEKNTKRRDLDFIQFHYDIGNDFYALFLDAEMVYSCAYFPTPQASLQQAQTTKLDLICRKLRLQPGQTLLDIGCGWGGLSCWAAQHYGVSVHGVTLSQAQLEFAQAKVKRLGLSDRVVLELKDYREIDAPNSYDAIAQVEMFEHVGFANHERHFKLTRSLLKPGGLYFHQASVRRGGPGTARPTPTTKVINRFIFPGGELDTIGMTIANMGRFGFEVLDVEDLREHFELTLRHWTSRLYAVRDKARLIVGESRTRLWMVYFALFAKGFERGAVLVYQTVARKRRAGASGLPLDRSSLYR